MGSTSKESSDRLPPRQILFGFVAIGLGMITKKQLDECLEIQRQKTGGKLLLGRIMLDKGYLTTDQIKKILSIQQREE